MEKFNDSFFYAKGLSPPSLT
ncbi:hypothetical protein EMIT0P43_30049 [Pseudomonas jessenii]